MSNKHRRQFLFFTAGLSVGLVSASANAFKDYGIDMGSCAPTSGWQALKESTNPGDFWFDVGVELAMTLEDWGDDNSVCIFSNREDREWCILTRRNMYQALTKCRATARYMSQKHNRPN